MFFFFPIRSDAPVYHWPYATVGLIVVNVFTFLITGGGYTEGVLPWMLEYGHFNPLEWVSVHFIHFGVMHLIGNMIFLWCFGLIVEGKVGWWRMLLFYMGIAVTGAMIIQLAMLGYTGDSQGAGGASLAVFGVMAVALVWAPKNNVDVFYFFFFLYIVRVGFYEFTVLTVALFYIGMNFLFASFSAEVGIGSEIAHLIGAGIGFALGVLLLKLKKVDCEGWDLFTVMSGSTHEHQQSHRHSSTAFETEQSRDSGADDDDEELTARLEKRKKRSIKKIHDYLSSENSYAALQEYQHAQNLYSNWKLSQDDLTEFITELYKERDWENAAKLMQTCIEQYPDTNPQTRLQFAALMIEIKERPRYALEIIKPISKQQLSDKQKKYLLKIEKKALKMIDDGVLELDGFSWK